MVWRETDIPAFVAESPRCYTSVPERIDFTMNGEEVVLMAAPKDVDLIPN